MINISPSPPLLPCLFTANNPTEAGGFRILPVKTLLSISWRAPALLCRNARRRFPPSSTRPLSVPLLPETTFGQQCQTGREGGRRKRALRTPTGDAQGTKAALLLIDCKIRRTLSRESEEDGTRWSRMERTRGRVDAGDARYYGSQLPPV